jgi:hypothetical protein
VAINNGVPANAQNFNDAFMSRTQNTSTIGQVSLENSNPASGVSVANAQAELNKLNNFVGSITNTPISTNPNYSNNEIGSNGDSLLQRVDTLSGRFNLSGGHSHSGAPGDGAPIVGGSIVNVPLEGWFNQGLNIDLSGSSIDVTAELPGAVPSNNPTEVGVVVNFPFNKVILREATGANAGTAFVTPEGFEIYGRLTEDSGDFTLSFFYEDGVDEEPYTFASTVEARWFYQALYQKLVSTPVYDPAAFIPSDTATADVVDASPVQRGVVNTEAQSFAGAKTFESTVSVQGNLQTNATANSVLTSNATGVVQGLSIDKGELVSSNGTSPVALPVGTDGQVLLADSSQAAGLRWAVAPGESAATTSFVPYGDIGSTNVQAAIEELADERAKIDLSNLGTTAVNAAIQPASNSTLDLGATNRAWRRVYASRFLPSTALASFSGDITTGSPTIANVASTLLLDDDQSVTGPGVQPGSFIVSKTVDSVTLNLPLTLTAAAQSYVAAYMGHLRSNAEVATADSGHALLKSGKVVDGDSGEAIVETGRAEGSGDSGDVILRTGSVGSGTRGRVTVEGRYLKVPERASDPADVAAGGLYWNTTDQVFRQSDGTQWDDLAGSGGGVGFQEDLAGAVNGTNKVFGPLSLLPSNDDSIIVFVNGLALRESEWTKLGSNVELAVAPSVGQRVHVFYLTDGAPAPAPIISNAWKTEYRTLTAGEIAAKELTLSQTPASPGEVMLDVIGGGPMFYGDDFIVTTSTLSWNGLSLDGVLSVGDRLRVGFVY